MAGQFEVPDWFKTENKNDSHTAAICDATIKF